MNLPGHKNLSKLMQNVQGLTGMTNIDPTKDPSKMTLQEERDFTAGISAKQNTMRNNADVYAEECPEYFTCRQYQPCPICNKCKAKASNLYVACQNCQIPICGHKYKDIDRLIKRDNFKMPITKSFGKILQAHEEALHETKEEVNTK